MDVMKLTPEEVSQAFLFLAGQQTQKELPPQLQELSQETWEELAKMLWALKEEQIQSTMH